MTFSHAHSLFEALSNADRLRFINLFLHFDNITTKEIQDTFNYSQTNVNRHLHYMKLRGILDIVDQKTRETRYFMKKDYKAEFTRLLSPYLNCEQFANDRLQFESAVGVPLFQ